MLYDHVLTLPLEITFVWRARRSFSRTEFLINKYLVIGGLLINVYCKRALLAVRVT